MRHPTPDKRHPKRNWPSFLLAMMLGLAVTFVTACGPKPLLENVTVEPSEISPNADGDRDIARINFYLNENATVSFLLTDAEGRQFTFRDPRRISVNEDPYSVYFSGVVTGYRLPTDDDIPYTILKRVLADGTYTWSIHAVGESGRESTVTGTLSIRNADTQLPGIRGFTVSPDTFSPNQDGIDDRVTINLVLEKDVEELRVYLEGSEGTQHSIPEDARLSKPNEAGWHTYDYDGGIDAGADPPPDGTYTIRAEARDAIGQQVMITNTLTLINAGLPRAYIVNGEVEYSATSLVISETLCFTLTVENDSDTYLRTTGPWPGTEYRSDQNFNTLGWSEESGVFRVAMDFDTSLRNYPFRWGIGTPGVDLVEIEGNHYLPPRARSVVTGCTQVVEVPVRNPLYYWMGLIHEDVAIAHVNNRVDPNFVTIWEP